MDNMNKPMNIKQASEYTGLSVHTLYKYVGQGKVPHHKPEGGRIFFYSADLDRWIKGETKTEEQK